jgi:hypothetical protein
MMLSLIQPTARVITYLPRVSEYCGGDDFTIAKFGLAIG